MEIKNSIHCCENWGKWFVDLNCFIAMGKACGLEYKVPPFSHCPWCGKEQLSE